MREKYKVQVDAEVVLALMYDRKKRELRVGGVWRFAGEMEELIRTHFGMVDIELRTVGGLRGSPPQKGWMVVQGIGLKAWGLGLRALQRVYPLTRVRSFRRLIR